MSEPSWDGLKLALQDGPPLSVIRSDEQTADPNLYDHQIIEKMVVEKARYIGSKKLFELKLNPWLNAIIGGRGTGKSTLLEFIRLGLNRRKEIPSDLEKEFEKYNKVPTTQDSTSLLTNKTKLTIYYKKDEKRFRVSWSANDEPYQIEKEVNGNWNKEGGVIEGRFPIQIFSQKQIFNLAKQPQALLKIVDQAKGVDYKNWKTDYKTIVEKYLMLKKKERNITAELKDESNQKSVLDDIENKLAVFEKGEHAKVLKQYKFRKSQQDAIAAWENQLAACSERIDQLTNFHVPKLNLEHFSDDVPHAKALVSEIANVIKAVTDEKDKINAAMQRLTAISSAWEEKKAQLGIWQEIAKAETDFTELKEKLKQSGTNFEQYNSLVKGKNELKKLLDGYPAKEDELQTCKEAVKSCLRKLKDERASITDRRKKFLQKVLQGGAEVKINVVPFGDQGNSLEEDFRKLINKCDVTFGDDVGKLLKPLGNKNPEQLKVALNKLKTILINIEKGDVKLDKRFCDHISKLRDEEKDRIQCWFPQDSLDVRYKTKDNQLKSIKEGSPGQKTAALLAFFMSYGEEPLILDQPEDDLDNQLIYDLIVKRLKEIKQKRQIIIVTHNANLVVNGDAENIVYLEAEKNQTSIKSQGGLQEKEVRKNICNVLEGGQEAFTQRYERISVQK